jgi:hypothetical protein
MSRDGLNREWASLYSGQELVRYRLTPTAADSDRQAAMLFVRALDSIDIDESDVIEFTSHLMLPVPPGWVLSRL